MTRGSLISFAAVERDGPAVVAVPFSHPRHCDNPRICVTMSAAPLTTILRGN
jgi:hypothetical protein